MNRPDTEKRDLISILLPAYNEQDNIPRCYEEITRVMEGVDCDYEVIVTDNASTDLTPVRCEEICARDTRWRYIRFSRNFSAENSITAGLRYASGQAVVILFSDLQEPPDLIPAFIEKWREGYEIVYGVQTIRHGDSPLKRLMVKVYYRLIRLLSDVPLPEYAADFRLMDRRVVNALNLMTERSRYLRGLSHWTGFRQIGLPYERTSRKFGHSSTSPAFLFSYALQAICAFTVRPLRLFILLGVTLMCLSVLLGVFYLGLYFFYGAKAPGITTVVLLLLAHLGLVSLGLGLLGEYIGNIYTEVKGRPLWIVDRTINIDIPEEQRYGR